MARRLTWLLVVVSLLLWSGVALAASYGEAPMLADKVKAGELPPVEERLPVAEDIMVFEPVDGIGKYGGTLRMMHSAAGADEIRMFLYDSFVRWALDYNGYIPGVFKDWEYNDDGTELTFHLRKGLKWSDGVPFTTADILFWWEDMAMNDDFADEPKPWWGFIDGSFKTSLVVIDEYTFKFVFESPNWNIPATLAQGYWNYEPMMRPKHYLSQFHPKYNPDLKDYSELTKRLNYWQVPGYPTLQAWVLTEYEPGVRSVFERNPYYWKVDTAGNQLPYIDSFVSEEISDQEVRVLKVISGEIDFSARGVPSPRNVPLLLDNAEQGNYRWLDSWINDAGGWPTLLINQTYTGGDDYLRELFRDKNFRRALSVAIDREEINDVIWYGFGTIQNTTISRGSWHLQDPEGQAAFEEWAYSFIEYDVELANQYLDAAGLKKSSSGKRLRADNDRPVQIILHVTEWGDPEVNQETAALLKKYWEAVGLEVIIDPVSGPEAFQLFDSGSGEYQIWMGHLAELDLWPYPDNVFVSGNAVRAWPQYTLWLKTGGEQGEPLDDIAGRLHELYSQGLRIADGEERHPLTWEAFRIHAQEGPFMIGTVGGLPMAAVANKDLRNVPENIILGPWAPCEPGNLNPSQFYFER
jgi:peptide/nickel transport system substrate-binding protein